ncbi:MAG: 6,7-dimethyl-8-ribityllumazine synthase [Candidatus Glassbacteria bacterium GWA2_58_10]|uniref:6,7-dimethyl-8-ribityllumazine synthase n=1 Tax=Candidatus Glassbacteria bacterium GWA2_58_10 TaxID=1817865 RepID=A0A1F5YEQ2_9BACT|nr:MAG: 6,7-dimethyl-8-ribityllumazine synthase [Candidatus Glassbacteria bacterium GWA2_58_10]
MSKVFEGKLDAKGKRVALVVSRFNDLVTSRLTAGALDCLVRHGASEGDISIFKVPGSFEISPLCRKLALSQKFDSVIAIGAVIRGDTPHFDYIAQEVAKGVAQVALEAAVPVVFGVLTTDNLEQALERAGAKAGNKGAEAALSAIEMMSLYSSGAF